MHNRYIRFIDLEKLHKPIRNEINIAINNVINRSAFIQGIELDDFEEAFAKYTNQEFAVGVSSGYHALELAKIAYLYKKALKEELTCIEECLYNTSVAIPANTFIATANAYSDCMIQFTDINPDNHLINIKEKLKFIKEHYDTHIMPDLVIPVHLYGQPCDMEGIMKLCKSHDDYNTDITIIEDACQAHGASTKLIGKGLATCYSFYPSKNLGCYDEKTEIFTSRGWINFKDLCEEDLVATIEDNIMRFRPTLKIFKYVYNGFMYKFHNKGIDLLVTPNHNMYIKIWNKSDFYLEEAWKLVRHSQWNFKQEIPYEYIDKTHFVLPPVFMKKNAYSGIIIPEREIDMNLWLEFLGYYISEGSVDINNGCHRITITQYPNSKYYNDMKNCIESLWGNTLKNEHTKKLSFCSQQIYEYLVKLGHSHEKHIPNEFKNLPPEKLKILLIALIKGDGIFLDDYPRKYYTVSKQLADDIQEIAIKCGIYTTISYNQDRKIYVLNFNKYINKTMVREKHVNLEFYTGNVYCCEVPSHILLVRRNGKVCWSGNSLGDGGMVTTNDKEIADYITLLRSYGEHPKNTHEFIGYNCRLDTIQAAVLNIKLKYLKEWNNNRKEIARQYHEELDILDVNYIRTLPHNDDSVYHLFVIEAANRNALKNHLASTGIETGIHYPTPIHKQVAYKGYLDENESIPIAEQKASIILSLPIHPCMESDEVKYVCKRIDEFYKTKNNRYTNRLT